MGWKSAGQRGLRWGLWTLVAWIFLRGVISLMPAGTAESAEPQKTQVQEIKEPAGLRAFPAMFAREYLTWQPTAPDERAERLRPYLAPGLDRQAGWTGSEGNGQQVQETWVYSTQQLSETRWEVTVAARILPDRTLFLSVPVAATPQGGWVVYGYPALVPPPAAGAFAEPPYFGQESTDQGDRAKTLLTGFFRAYFEQGDATYYLAPGTSVRAMRGGWAFDSVSKVVLLSQGTGTWAIADVGARDTATGARFTFRYTLQLTERDGRWYIQAIQQRGE